MSNSVGKEIYDFYKFIIRLLRNPKNIVLLIGISMIIYVFFFSDIPKQ